MYLDVFGQPMVTLGTHESAVELLEKRSANYSDRMHSVMAALWVCCLSSVLLSLT